MADRRPRSLTSFDVARLAGVSRSTVSRALAGGAAVTEEARAKVFAAAEELGYRVNSLARGLQTGQSDIVGLVASRLDTPIRARQIRLLTEGLLARGFRPMLITADGSDEVGPRLHSLLGYNVAGMIITSDSPSPEIAAECARRGIPVVLINRDPKVRWGDRVEIDAVEGGKMAYRLLRDAGARTFACLAPAEETWSVAVRADAFVRSARGAGGACRTIHAEGQSHGAGRKAVLAAREDLAGVEGLFCATDLLALGALDALRSDLGLRIPQDIQVAGFDDIEQASWPAYDLSTIRQDIAEQSALALGLLTDRLARPDRRPQTRRVALVAVRRGTTRSCE